MPVQVDLLEGGTVLALTLDQPKGNVIDMKLMRELGDALARNEERQHLRLVILRGSGGSFSYGASVSEHRPETVEGMLGAFVDLVRRIAYYPVAMTALVEGRCYGGAFELVLACPFVFATEKAVFACPEIKLGVFPPALVALGPARLGWSLSERLLLTGGDLTASEGRARGFISEIVDDADPLGKVLEWYRATLLPLSAFALRQARSASTQAVKSVLDGALDGAVAAYLERVVPSHDGKEGIEAFLARRAPKWVDA